MPIQVTDLPEKYQKAVLDQLKAAYGKPKARGSSKYHAEKITVNGITFDSKKEARRWLELTALEQAGKIHGLRRQVKYLLIPEQRESCAERYKSGPKKGQFKPGRVLERECAYYADFDYYKDGTHVVEDVKGVRTKEYRLKKKMLLYTHKIRISEV